MSVIKMFFKVIFQLILPNRLYKALDNRINRTKSIMNANRTLQIFWKIIKVLLFPVSLLFSMAEAIVKAFVMWILTHQAYDNLVAITGVFYRDITVDKHGFKKALRRMKLHKTMLKHKVEQKKSYGEKNPDKTFYVIRPYYYTEHNELIDHLINLLGYYYYVLQHLAYAVEKGWIPVVDWENYGPFVFGEKYAINGTKNCWEYYWNPLSDYTLDEVYQSKNVILSKRDWRNEDDFIPSAELFMPLQHYARYQQLKCPQYDRLISLNDYTLEYINNHQEKLFPKNSKILGVSHRSVFYNFPNHPAQPDIFDLIRIVRNTMKAWEMDYVFFTCETEDAASEMKKAFKDKAIILPRDRYKKHPTLDDNPLYRHGNRYQVNLDYLTEIVLLSRCHSLFASISSGTKSALIWNANKYENMHIIDMGLV